VVKGPDLDRYVQIARQPLSACQLTLEAGKHVLCNTPMVLHSRDAAALSTRPATKSCISCKPLGPALAQHAACSPDHGARRTGGDPLDASRHGVPRPIRPHGQALGTPSPRRGTHGPWRRRSDKALGVLGQPETRATTSSPNTSVRPARSPTSMNHRKQHRCHSGPHHRWAGPPRNQGATRRSRSKVSFGAPPSLISSRNFEPLPVPQVALRTLNPSGDSVYQNEAEI
jgi:hypothetical protein